MTEFILLFLWFGSINAFIVGIIWLILCMVRKKTKLRPIGLMICSVMVFILSFIGIVTSDESSVQKEEMKTENNEIVQTFEERSTEKQESAKTSGTEKSTEKQIEEETTQRVQTKDELFAELKKESDDFMRDEDSDNELVNVCLSAIEENFDDVKSSKSWSDFSEKEIYASFITAIAFFDTHYEEGSAGKEIGKSGWAALKSLYMEDGKFEESMELLKENCGATSMWLKEERFAEYKRETEDSVKNWDFNDEKINAQLNAIEKNYFKVKALESWDAAGNENGFFEFVGAISFFDINYEEGSIGKEIGKCGWLALESLFKEDGKFEENMDLLKVNYEASGRHLYQNKYPEGQYRVGTDIESGEYVFFSEASSAYFAVTKDANGNDIIANNNFTYNSIMTIYEGEYLELIRCYAVPIDEVKTLPLESANMLKVGVHLSAGEYKLIAGERSAYYCIYGDGRQNNIVANNNFSNQSYISVTDGQYLELSRCHIEQEKNN